MFVIIDHKLSLRAFGTFPTIDAAIESIQTDARKPIQMLPGSPLSPREVLALQQIEVKRHGVHGATVTTHWDELRIIKLDQDGYRSHPTP